MTICGQFADLTIVMNTQMVHENGLDEKQKKKAKQEAAQKASQISKSGLPFYCTILDECVGDPGALLDAMLYMNTPIKKKDGETVRDIASVAKLVVSSNDEQIAILAYVPKHETRLNAYAWLQPIVAKWEGLVESMDAGGNTIDEKAGEMCMGLVSDDPQRDVNVFKLRDAIISEQYDRLRKLELLPAAEEDDEVLLSDDVFD